MTLISCNEQSICTVKESLAVGVPAVTNPIITHDKYNTKRTLTPTSTVPATKVVNFSQALTAGAATIDLTAVTGADGTIDLTGLKVQFIRIVNGTTDSAGTVSAGSNSSVAVTGGASNGYDFMGSAGKVTIPAGGRFEMSFADNAPDVAAGDKTIDLAGTGTNAFQVTIVAG